jgi:anti-sigma factor RsiW
MKAPERIDLLLLVHAYCDGELNPVAARAIERQILLRPELAAERARILAVRELLAGQRAAHAALLRNPRGFARALRFVRRQLEWPRMRRAAAMAACAVLSCGLTWLVVAHAEPDSLLQELAASHTRALLASRITDVPSSDRHMVKPWLSARSAIAPRVVDLTSEGFPLLGGRLDIIQKIPVATLVYGERQHVLSVTALPLSAARSAPRGMSSVEGLNAFGWTTGDVVYWVISDVDAVRLEEFASRFRRQ